MKEHDGVTSLASLTGTRNQSVIIEQDERLMLPNVTVSGPQGGYIYCFPTTREALGDFARELLASLGAKCP